VDQADVTRPFCPRRLGARHNSGSRVACRSSPCGRRLRFRGTALSRPRPPGAAPDLSIGIYCCPGNGHRTAPGAENLHAGRKGSDAPFTALGLPGATGWLPAWGRPAGSQQSPKTALTAALPAKMMLSAENIGNFPLNALRPGHAVGQARPQDAPGRAASRVRGGVPGSTVSPPRCPGPPLRLRHLLRRRRPVWSSANRSGQRHCPIGQHLAAVSDAGPSARRRATTRASRLGSDPIRNREAPRCGRA
jgi:hypothetical protein